MANDVVTKWSGISQIGPSEKGIAKNWLAQCLHTFKIEGVISLC